MFWNASIMNGYAIAGRDGQIGTLTDMLFDDSDWTMRWFIIDTGRWLPGREVFLPVSAVHNPHPKEWLPVDLTTQQIKESPELDKSKPIERQAETEIYQHYGWKPYWENGPSDARAAPDGLAPGRAGQSRLRSLGTANRSRIEAGDGEIGYLEDVILDSESWRIQFIKIYTSDWWHGHRVLIAPEQIGDVDWEAKLLRLNVSRETIRNSPPYDPEMTEDDKFKQTHLSYYGLSVRG